jgi:hypothetical protein
VDSIHSYYDLTVARQETQITLQPAFSLAIASAMAFTSEKFPYFNTSIT